MKRILGLVILCFFPVFSHSKDDILPKRFVENVNDGIIVTYEFPSPYIKPNSLIQGTSFVLFNGFGINDINGEPAIPFRSDMFYIPKEFVTQIDTVETSYNDTTFILSPSIPSCVKDEISMQIDSIKPYLGFFPNSIIEHVGLDEFRGAGLQRITIMPVQYDYEHHIIRFYSKIKYKISFLNKATNTNSTVTPNKEINKIKDFLSKVTLNYNTFPSSLQRETNNTQTDNKNYLIVTTNNYLDSLHAFIEWKRIKGNRIFLQSKNRGEWTTDSIKHVIDSINSLSPLDYVLTIGGFDDVPADSFSYDGGGKYIQCVTDYAYGLPTANLQIPQISRGRIPVDNPQELSPILDKIIKYERNPPKDDKFYKTALHGGEFSDYDQDCYEDACFIQTNENLREHLIHNYNFQIHQSYYFVNFIGSPATSTILHWNYPFCGYGETLPDSLQPSSFNWSVNQVLSKINEGTLYVLYNGHGSTRGWVAPGFPTDINLLQNGNKQPIIFSIACLTGKYNENGNCFAESILKKEAGGCVGIFAATETSFYGHDDAMVLGMFDAIWPNLQLVYGFKEYNSYTSFVTPVFELGKILDLGFLRMAETFGRSNLYNRREATKRLYHYFGDPSMMIYTDVPQNFIEPAINYSNGKICVQSPCDSTRITFYTPSATNPIIDSFIGDSIEYETDADSVIICLDKHNYVPYVQTFYKNLYIQNDTINNTRNYVGKNIFIGNHVTTEKPIGDVIVENANVSIQGNSVELHPGTRINQSNVKINVK